MFSFSHYIGIMLTICQKMIQIDNNIYLLIQKIYNLNN